MGKYQPSILGIRLKEARKQVGLRQEDLAERSGVGKISISRLESGIVQWCSSETLQRLEKALGASLGETGRCASPDVITNDNSQNTPRAMCCQCAGIRSIPVIGKIPTQDPRVEPMLEKGSVDVPEFLLPEGEACACIVDDWSMREAGYLPGDIAIIARCYWSHLQTAQDCAITHLGETKLVHIDIRGDGLTENYWIVPQNQEVDGEKKPLYPARQINPNEYQMEGKVFAIMRRIGN